MFDRRVESPSDGVKRRCARTIGPWSSEAGQRTTRALARRVQAARAAARAVLRARCSAGRRGRRRGRAAGRRPRPRQPRGRAAAARRRGARARPPRGRTSTATRRSAGCRALREAIAARYRAVYGVELDPEREVAVVPGTKTAIVELALALAERGDTILLPDPYYPDYPSGHRARRRRDRARAARPGRRLAARPRRRAAGRGASSSTTRRTRAPSAPRPGIFEAAVAYADRTGTAIVHDAAYIDLVFDGRAAARASSRRRARRRSASSSGRCRRPTGWPAGGSASSSATPSSSSAINLLERPLPRRDASRRSSTPRSRRSTARRTSVEERRADLRAPPRPARRGAPGAAGLRGHLLRLAAAARGADAPSGCSLEHRVAVAPGEGFGPSGAGWARLSLAVSDEMLDARDRAARARARGGRAREDRDRRPVLLVVLGRGRRALREPGRRAAGARARGEDPDGPRPARAR